MKRCIPIPRLTKTKCIALFIIIGVIILTVLSYILIGVNQCYVPVKGVEVKTCTDVVNELMQTTNSSNTTNPEIMPVHQHNISLDLSKLHYDSRKDWMNMFENYKFHNGTMARSVIEKYYPHLLELYDSYPEDIQRADVSRVAILHHYGGIYTDIDAFPRYQSQKLRNYKVDDVQSAYFPVGEGNVAVNHFFITNKNNAFLGYLLDSYETFNRRWKWMPLPYLRVFLTTGPCALQIALHNWQKMWEEKGVSPAPSVELMTQPHCLAKHETGRQWLSIDGLIFNWIGDNPTLFIYGLVTFILIVILIVVVFVIRRRHSAYIALKDRD